MANIKDFTGAVNIEADITPITRQPIGQITPEKWNEMDDASLWDQRITLNNRVIQASQSGHAGLAQQVQAGINMIDAILRRNADRAQKEREDAGNGSLI